MTAAPLKSVADSVVPPQPCPGVSLPAHIVPESGTSAPSAREGRQSPSWHHPRGAFPALVPQNWSYRSVVFIRFWYKNNTFKYICNPQLV